jgi:hypothetical protein
MQIVDIISAVSRNEAARKKVESLSEFLTSDGANLFKEGEAGVRAVKHPRGVGYMRRTFSREGMAPPAEHEALLEFLEISMSIIRQQDTHVCRDRDGPILPGQGCCHMSSCPSALVHSIFCRTARLPSGC